MSLINREVTMSKYFDFAKKQIKNNSSFPNILAWYRFGLGANIPNCINSKEAFKEMKVFASATGIEIDKIFALTAYLLALVPYTNEPKAIAECSLDFDGVFDFSFTIDDYVKVLKNKRPTSKPKHDPKKKKFVPEYKDVKATYIFGLTFDPKTGLIRLRYKLYPKKNWWGLRYEEKYRSFKDTLKFLTNDLLHYYAEEDVEFSAPDENSEDYEEPTGDPEEMEDELNPEDVECTI